MIEEQIKATLGRELNVAGMLVQQALDVELRKVSTLNSQQVIFMLVLKCDREMPVADMCRQFGILPAEVDAFLAPLLKDELITRAEMLTLTRTGEEVLGKLWFTIEKTEKQILAGFSEAEASQFKAQLRQIQANCVGIIGG